MSITTCPTCLHEHTWSWEEAFDKFGFEDGDGLVMTGAVAQALRRGGYTVSTEKWGLHNVVIVSLQRDGVEQIPERINLGYDDPRAYLPPAIVALLDAAFTPTTEVEP